MCAKPNALYSIQSKGLYNFKYLVLIDVVWLPLIFTTDWTVWQLLSFIQVVLKKRVLQGSWKRFRDILWILTEFCFVACQNPTLLEQCWGLSSRETDPWLIEKTHSKAPSRWPSDASSDCLWSCSDWKWSHFQSQGDIVRWIKSACTFLHL